MLDGLSNYGVNYEHFLGPDLERFQSGLVVSGGIHMTKLSEKSFHQELILEGKQSIKPGESHFGARLAASYRWYSDFIFAGAGIEGSKVGKANIFLPLKVQIGIIF